MAVALFDLDNTLLGGDSDFAWGEFACEQGLVDAERYAPRNEAFFQDYRAGRLDIVSYLRHALSALAGQDLETTGRWHEHFMRTKIEPMLQPAARTLLERHRRQGDLLLIITATNRFIAAPIAQRLGVDELLASDCEIRAGRYTGEPVGDPCYGEGKVRRLRQWLAPRELDLSGSHFYSDSHNDLPLLTLVEHPVAVDPDPTLRRHARQRGWPIISLKSGPP